jgi:hypothetical protein
LTTRAHGRTLFLVSLVITTATTTSTTTRKGGLGSVRAAD